MADGVMVQNFGSGRLNLSGGVSLPPGQIVKIGVRVWEKCLEHPITKFYLSSGQVRVVSGSVEVEPSPKVVAVESPHPEPDTQPDIPIPEDEKDAGDGIAGMKAKDAIAYVRDCDNVEELEEMCDVEKRLTVVDAIDDRILELGEQEG